MYRIPYEKNKKADCLISQTSDFYVYFMQNKAVKGLLPFWDRFTYWK